VARILSQTFQHGFVILFFCVILKLSLVINNIDNSQKSEVERFRVDIQMRETENYRNCSNNH
jgi:hypothetical protein